MTEEKSCFRCKNRISNGKKSFCGSEKAVKYIHFKKPCIVCGRNPDEEKGGCAECVGHGVLIKLIDLDTCDCNDFKEIEFKPI